MTHKIALSWILFLISHCYGRVCWADLQKKRSLLDYDVFRTNKGIPRKNLGKYNKFVKFKSAHRLSKNEDFEQM